MNQFILQIMFGSIFKTYHGAPILCCITTGLGIFHVKWGFFGTVLRIFGVAFVRALQLDYSEIKSAF